MEKKVNAVLKSHSLGQLVSEKCLIPGVIAWFQSCGCMCIESASIHIHQPPSNPEIVIAPHALNITKLRLIQGKQVLAIVLPLIMPINHSN